MAIFTAIGTGAASLAATAGFSAATAASIGAIAAGAAQSFAVNTAVSYINGRNQPSFDQARQQKPNILATLSQADAQRTRSYGQVLLGGVRAFHETKDGVLYQIILLNDGRMDGTIKYWINGRPVDVADNRVTSGPQAGYVNISARSGNTGIAGASYNFIPDEFSDIFDETWLEGQATVGVSMRPGPLDDFQKTWPRGSQTDIQWEGRGTLVFDFRALTTAYSDNAAEVIGNYLVQPEGFGIGFSKLFNSQDMIDFSNICDELVSTKDGGAEPRYRIWGTVGFAEQPKAVLQRMLAACDARVYQKADGNLGIIGGKYVAPDFTLTADDIYEFSYRDGVSRRDAANVVRSFYTDQGNSYQDTEADPWEDTAALATQPERATQFDTVMSPSHSQTRRLMKIHLNRLNRDFTLTVVTNLVGIKARFPQGGGHHTIRVQWPDFDDFDEVCEVLSHTIFPVTDGEGNVTEWRCRIELGAIDPEWWEWDAATEEGDKPTFPAFEDQLTAIPLLEALTSNGSSITATYFDIKENHNLQAEARQVGSTSVTQMTETDNVATLTGLTAGTEWQVRAKYTTSFFGNVEGKFSAWSAPITV